jgi:hypothetical protein
MNDLYFSKYEHLYDPFNDELLKISSENFWNKNNKKLAEKAINGASIDALEELIPLDLRAEAGVFFSDNLVCKAAFPRNLISDLKKSVSIFDPACGAGNLLVHAAKYFSIENNLEKTIAAWAVRIGGCDINLSFVHATRARLVLLAMQRHGFPILDKSKIIELQNEFVNIKKSDYLCEALGSKFDWVLTNPPFFHSDDDTLWSKGRSQIAAVFIAKILERAKNGQKILAILPDVLRSGTRYGVWRSLIAQNSNIFATKIYGRFSKKIDVDVFFLRMEKKNSSATSKAQKILDWSKTPALGSDENLAEEYFNISVGPVVPHRHKDLGEKFPFLTAKNSLPNSILSNIDDKRGFSGKKYNAPFIVLRRTSNPSDVNRLVATLISEGNNIAVENHLIVIQPKDLNQEKCIRLMKYLADEKTKIWVNNAIRCRHLTTHVLKKLPISGALLD